MGCYDAEVFKAHDNCYFEEYWQTPEYFEQYRSNIINIFQFPPFSDSDNIAMEEQIKKDNSVALHIRMGDYVGSAEYAGICTLDYYRKAIESVKDYVEKPAFFIFSNDMGWCKENIFPMIQEYEVSFVDFNTGKDSYKDMNLMSLARCYIIANNTFSW